MKLSHTVPLLRHRIQLKFKPCHPVPFWALLLLFVLPIAFYQISDVDVWWHMQLGQSILTDGFNIDFSTYYFSPTVNSVKDLRFTFLGDILLYLVYLGGGDVGLQCLRLVIVLSACYVILLIVPPERRYTGLNLLICVLLVVGTIQLQLMRNALFSLVFVPGVFLIWHYAKKHHKQKMLLWYPVLMGLWNIIHGSYLLGFTLMAALMAGDLVDIALACMRQGPKHSRQCFIKSNALWRYLGTYVGIIVMTFLVISYKNPTTYAYLNPIQIKSWFTSDNRPKTVLQTDRGAVGGRAQTKLAAIISNVANSIKASGLSYFQKRLSDVSYSEEGLRFIGRLLMPRFDGFNFSPVVQQQNSKSYLSDLKKRLNNTIFKTAGRPSISMDFMSPFDLFHFIYVKVAVISGFLVLLLMFIDFKSIRFAYLFSLCVVLMLGCGYVRMVGYLALVSAIVFLFRVPGAKADNQFIQYDKYLFCISLILTGALWLNSVCASPVYLANELKVTGFGRIPVYSQKCPDYLLKHYPDSRTFTSIGNGGYLLKRWFPKKRVFIDGFFAPHSDRVRNDYEQILRCKKSADDLVKNYGIDTALIPLNSGKILKNFMKGENHWIPECLDEGQLLFVYRPNLIAGESIKLPLILIGSGEFENLPNRYKQLFAIYVYQVGQWLLEKGRIADATDFFYKNVKLVAAVRPFVPEDFIKEVTGELEHYRSAYGKINHIAIQYEQEHYLSLKANREDAAIQFGLKVLKDFPKRYKVAFNVASVYALKGEIAKSRGVLDDMTARMESDPSALNHYRFKIAKLYKNLYELYVEKEPDRTWTAYRLLQGGFRMDNSVVSSGSLYSCGNRLYHRLLKEKKVNQGLMVLQTMLKDIPEEGRVKNDLAWHLLTTGPSEKRDVMGALALAVEAVKLMQKNNDVTLDAAYDTVAEAYFQLKQYDKMKVFEDRAIASAPARRKVFYTHRIIPKN